MKVLTVAGARPPFSVSKFAPALKAILLGLLITGALVAVTYLVIDGAMVGSKRMIIEGILIMVLPLMLYAAVVKPIFFPLGFYVFLVPFDNILRIPSFGTLTKLLGICSALALMFWLVRKRRFATPSKAFVMWLVLLVWMALSVIWAIQADDALAHMVTYASLFGLYTVVSIMPFTQSDLKVFLGAVVLGSVVAAAYGLYQYHSGGPMVQNQVIAGVHASRVFVKLGEDTINPNAFGAALLLPIALVLMSFLQRRWGLQKFAFAGILMVLMGGLIVSGSRGALLALGMMVLYMLIRSRYKLQLLLLSLLGIAVGLTHAQSIWIRFAIALKTGGAGRLSIWAVGWDAFKRHWLVGAGVGNFANSYDQSFINIYQAYDAKWHRASHNTPLTMAVELGLIGLILGATAWYVQWRSLRFIHKTDRLYDLRIALESAVVGLVVTSIFLELMSDKYAWLVFQVIAGVTAYASTRPDLINFMIPPQAGKFISKTFDREARQKVPTNA